jgi:PAS domain S-box-containing protein
MMEKTFFRGKNLVVALVFCAGILCSLVSFWLLRDRESRYIRARVEAWGADRAEEIERGFRDNLDTLYALSSFYASSKAVERKEFRTFAQRLLSKHPDIFEFRWMLRVAGKERQAYEESMRKEGFAGLNIREFDSSYNLVNAVSKPEYFCIDYIEPVPEDKDIFGVDASSDPLRWEAMQKARDSASAVSTGNIRLVGERENKYAFRVYLPVYENESPHDTLQEWRDNLRGFLVLLFQIDKMVELSLADLSPTGLDIYIYDETGGKKGELLYFHSSRLRRTKAAPAAETGQKRQRGLEVEKAFDAAGRKWSIVCRPIPEFISERRSWDSWMALFFGIMLTVIAMVYLSALTSRHARIEALIEERTKELRESEAQVRRAADEWKDTFDAITDLIFIQDKDFNILKVNKAFCDAFKSRPEDLIGKKCYQVVHNSDKPWPGCPSQKAFADSHPQTDEIFDNNVGVPLLVRVSPIFDKDGKVVGTVHIATDITERKKAEEALKASEKKFKELAETTTDWVWEVDENGIYTYTNPKVKDFLGYEASEVLGKTPFYFMPEDEAKKISKFFAEKVIKKGAFYGLENICRHRDGHLVVLETNAIPVLDKGGRWKGYRGIDRDITERKKAEEEIKEAMRVKSEFTSVVSHELRTPLTAIKEGICIVLEGSAGKINQEQKRFLDVAKRNVDRLWRLINNVLDYQKLDSGGMEYDIKENDLNTLVREVEETMRPVAEEKKLEFSTRLAENLEQVKCDRDRITQVLTNLVNNAIKFTDKGAITISTQKRENAVVISVKDTGRGIKQENMDKLFQDFSQLGKGKERETGSTGLGLAISRKIIQQHGGQIWVESEYGRGSVFSFLLPMEVKKG